MRANPNPASVVSVPHTTVQVKPLLPLAVLPAGVRLSAGGLTLIKRCPACGGSIVVANEPGAARWLAARNRVCRPCDEDMHANGLAWMPMPETTIAFGAACHCGYGDCEICHPVD